MDKIEIRHTGTLKGRGVFARANFKAGDLIEVAPVIVMREQDFELLKRTQIYNYFFAWGSGGQTAIALGLGSIYNHSNFPNAKHIREYENEQIRFVAIREIKLGEEILVNYLGDYKGRAKNKEVWFENRTP